MLRKERDVFFQIYRRFRRKKNILGESAKKDMAESLKNFQEALLAKDLVLAKKYREQASSLLTKYLPKTMLEKGIDVCVALLFALVLATVVRQTWFELYEIPTGSMRPTLEEKDRVLVSKTAFGINTPLKVEHFYFDPTLVARNAIVTFTSENLDLADTDTRYFYLFPGKKQFVKRLIGKPGDLLYFYGGKIYGLDASGEDISEVLEPQALAKIDHIPFIRFEGQVTFLGAPVGGIYQAAVVHQMGEAVAILDAAKGGGLLPTLYNSQLPKEYSSLWGMENFSMVRLLTRHEAMLEGEALCEDAPLYLKLVHHPRLNHIRLVESFEGKMRPGFLYETSFIPIQKEEMKKLFSNLYTARFSIAQGIITQYGADKLQGLMSVKFTDIPDGTYEFYYGKAYKVGWGGILELLEESHPIYAQTEERLMVWFNLGMGFHPSYLPSSRSGLIPHRYAYFRNGDFYVMGQPLWNQGERILERFIQKEIEKSVKEDYLPLIDLGPPTKEKIAQYGLKIPEGQYLVLGDNHAMSGDSRIFGPIPQENLRGALSWIFWPYGSRFGAPYQPNTPFVTLPHVVIFGLVGGICVTWFLIHRYRTRLPIKEF